MKHRLASRQHMLSHLMVKSSGTVRPADCLGLLSMLKGRGLINEEGQSRTKVVTGRQMGGMPTVDAVCIFYL